MNTSDIKSNETWLSRCRKIIFEGHDPETILDGICRTVVEEGPFSLAWFGGQVQNDSIILPVHFYPQDRNFPDAEGFDISSSVDSPAAVAWSQSRTFIISDIQADMNFPLWQISASAQGFSSVVAIPVSANYRLSGIWTLYADDGNQITREIIEKLDELSGFMGLILGALEERAAHVREFENLEKSEKMYRSVFENTGTGTIIIDYDMTIMHANAKFISMTGFTREEIENRMKWSQFIAPQDNERMQRYHFGRRRKEPDIPTEYECRIIDRAGRLKYIDMKVGMIPDTKHSIASFMDITTRKLAENHLRESESRLSAIIEAFEGFIYISDHEYRMVFMNRNLRERSGGSGIGSLCYKILHGLDKPCEWCGQAKVLAGGTVRKEIRSPLDDRWYSFTRTPVRQIDGKVERIQAIMIDITDRKLAEEALAKKADVLTDENRRLKSSIKERYKFGDIIGKSPAMQSVYELILKAASSNAHVIIQGESGTGKELVARAIHNMSDRKSQKFVPVNCGAISETIIESEFFGYRKGAFTGAHRDKPGYLDVADGGTLFLDEIGEIGIGMQVKLLRAIEGGGYTPVGDNTVRHTNLRIVAATNRNLKELVKQGDMRQDFFYRIHVIPVQLPALRERDEDLLILIDHFITKFSGGNSIPRISGNMLEAFMRYSWPGNIRELENVIRRYVTIGNLDFFESLITDPETQAMARKNPVPEIPKGLHLEEALNLAEKAIIKQALEDYRWQKGKAAEALGIHRKTLFTKMKKLGMK